MIERVAIAGSLKLDDYETHAPLVDAVRQLRNVARSLVSSLAGRRVVMLSSAAAGGGVAEMMPRLVSLLRDLGVQTEWLVVHPTDPDFFALTKQLHNLIHGHGVAQLGQPERELYDATSQRETAELVRLLSPEDLLIVHDPQP